MDLFNKQRIKELQQQVASLSAENKELKWHVEQKTNRGNDLFDKIKFLKESIVYKDNEITSMCNEINSLKAEDKLAELDALNKQIEAKRALVSGLDDEIHIRSLGIYEPVFNFPTSKEFKAKIKENLRQQKKMVKHAILGNINVAIDNDHQTGSNLCSFIAESSTLALNLSCDSFIAQVTAFNLSDSRAKMEHIKNSLNNGLKILHKRVNEDYFALKLEALILTCEHKIKLEEEKEEKKRQAEIIREQKRVEEEMAVAKAKLEKELKHYEQQKNCLQSDWQEDCRVTNKIIEIQEQLEKCDYRLANQKAGYLYIISNCDMKDGMVKLGVTRRLNPMDRVDELGNASHAFKYNVHGMVFSEDCFKLEAQIHKYFDNKRVNRINTRKEYFYATLDEVQAALASFGYNTELQECINEEYLLSEVQ